METERPKDLGFLKDFAGLDVAKLLGVQDKARLSALVDRYRYYTTGEIAEVEFQTRAVKAVLEPRTGTMALEIATGGGKTVIAAQVAKEHVAAGGKAVYVCPNAAALGSEISGIIQIFHRVFSYYKVPARIGQVNAPSKVNDVNFFTPMGLLGLRKTSPALFDQLLDLSTVILLDEAHHFPENDNGALKVFGEVPKIAKERFHDRGKKVVAFTATYGRLDGKTVVGKAPGFKFTVKDSVEEGRAPEVHGMQIYLPFKCPNATRTAGSDFDLKLDDQDYIAYWRLIAGYMTEIWRRRPVPLAAFVRLRVEAAYLVKLFNLASGLKEKGLAVLTGDMSVPERERVINAVKDGSLMGYVTCGVGVESIDIPKLEVIHLIQRTRSINKVVQAVGRALRPWKGKPRALIVDYQVMKENIINGCNGILLYAKGAGIDPDQTKTRANGSALVAIDGAPSTIIPDQATFGECEEWVIRGIKKDVCHTEKLLRLAATGVERPKESTPGEWEGVPMRVLAYAFYRLRDENNKEYDQSFLERLRKIENVHISWLLKRGEDMQERKREILRRAATGEPKPKWNSKDHELAVCLSYWTSKKDPRYDAVFTEKLRQLRPDWFGELPHRMARIPATEIDPRILKYGASPAFPPPFQTPAKDHWISTGIFVERSTNRMEKGELQSVILDFVRTGRSFPTYFTRGNPDCYFVSGSVSVPASRFRHKDPTLVGNVDDEILVPTVWYLKDFTDDISDFTDRDSRSGALGHRLYDADFSWQMKFKRPHLKFLRSAFTSRDRAILYMLHGGMQSAVRCPAYGLTKFELLVKERERKILGSIQDIDFEDMARELELFYLVDGEFPMYLNEDADILSLPSCEADIRYRDAEYVIRPRPYFDGIDRFSRVEQMINEVYLKIFRKLQAREISSSGWADLDESFQDVLCADKRTTWSNLDPFSDDIQSITDIETLRKEHRNDIVSRHVTTVTKKDYRKGIDRFEAIRLLWLSKTNYKICHMIEKLEPGAAEEPILMLRKTRNAKKLEELALQNEKLRGLMDAARSGEPFPKGISIEGDLIGHGFEEFLYDERIDWLRELENERARNVGMAVQAAP